MDGDTITTQDIADACLRLSNEMTLPGREATFGLRLREIAARALGGSDQASARWAELCNPDGSYRPVTVEAAARIGAEFAKDLVVIVAEDEQHGKAHWVTWGRSAELKVAAARFAESLCESAGFSPSESDFSEDFRRGSDGVDLIAAERQRVLADEGFGPSHDAAHENGELVLAAARYALWDLPPKFRHDFEVSFITWPWDWEWWKPRGRLRNLIRAGQLIAAEIERVLAHDPPEESTRPALQTLEAWKAEGSIDDWNIDARKDGLRLTAFKGDLNVSKVVTWHEVELTSFDVVTRVFGDLVKQLNA